MNKFVKGLIIGGAVGAGAMAVRAYRRDEETDSARNDIVRGAAVGAAVGVALGLISEAKPAFETVSETIFSTVNSKQTKKRLDKMRRSAKKARRYVTNSRSKLTLRDWSEIVAAMSPIMSSFMPVWQKRSKQRTSAGRAATAVMNGPLGRVRFSTMNMGEAFSKNASRMTTKMRRPGGHSHNGSH